MVREEAQGVGEALIMQGLMPLKDFGFYVA